MDLKSLIGGIGFFILGVLTCIGSYDLGLGRLDKPGTGFIFFIPGLVIVFLSVTDIIKGICAKGAGIKKLLTLWEGAYWGRAVLLLTGTLVYVLVLDPIGFLLPTFLYLGFSMRLLGAQKWFVSIMVSVFSTFGFYLLVRIFYLPISPLPRFLGF